ncbi:hypothetical protein X551_04114 [Methylibium sp. T29]|nr:hypothetical protein X551_04114 [Methylibium sp. T29]EWS57825.1 hypothetical protein Y694_04231 [Methylibium sp. T29-B]
MKVGSAMRSSGSRNHSAAADAPSSSAEITSWRNARPADGSRSVQRGPTLSVRCRRHSPRKTASASSSTAAPARKPPGRVCSSDATSSAPHSSPSAPKAVMPSVNAAALKAITRAICGGASPAAAYSRIRTAPPVSGPRPMVLASA